MAYGQPVRINGLRIGLDPVRTATFFFKEKNPYNNKFFINSYEFNAEVIGPYRTSIVAEAGFVKAHVQPLNATVDYYSSGNYYKMGLDFNLIEEDGRFEFDLGWRLGLSDYREKSFINLKGSYWENNYTLVVPEMKRFANWGEILVSQKMRLFYHNHHLNDLWLGIGLRLKFMNSLPNSDGGVRSVFIPGYGLYNPFSPGLSFSLAYKMNFKRSVIHELIHKHSNEFITR